jgi:hypothetical protein
VPPLLVLPPLLLPFLPNPKPRLKPELCFCFCGQEGMMAKSMTQQGCVRQHLAT